MATAQGASAEPGTELSAARCLERAQSETGLSDFGDATLAARVGEVVAQIRRLRLSPEGERAAAETIHRLLVGRLRFFEDRRRIPALESEPIRAPLIATGEPRSGTTLLHSLLAQDPNTRAPRFWQVMDPSPPGGLAKADDPRRALADAEWREINAKIPAWMKSHPYNDMLGDAMPECERLWAFDFRGAAPSAWWRVPLSTMDIGVVPDPRAQYRLHRMHLQHGQHGLAPKHWALKGVTHHLHLKELFETYPDARVIWVHRDPVQVAASRIVLVGQIVEAIVGSLDWKTYAAQSLAISRANFRQLTHEPLAGDARIHHLLYRDFVRDPVGRLREAYARFGIGFGAAIEKDMQAWLASNKSDRYGKFVYSLDVLGEDIEALYREFAPYQERYRIPREERR